LDGLLPPRLDVRDMDGLLLGLLQLAAPAPSRDVRRSRSCAAAAAAAASPPAAPVTSADTPKPEPMAPKTATCGELWRELSLTSEPEPLLEQELPWLRWLGKAGTATCGLEKHARTPPRPAPAARCSLVPTVVSIAMVSIAQA
jgi:hypothetical protein